MSSTGTRVQSHVSLFNSALFIAGEPPAASFAASAATASASAAASGPVAADAAVAAAAGAAGAGAGAAGAAAAAAAGAAAGAGAGAAGGAGVGEDAGTSLISIWFFIFLQKFSWIYLSVFLRDVGKLLYLISDLCILTLIILSRVSFASYFNIVIILAAMDL